MYCDKSNDNIYLSQYTRLFYQDGYRKINCNLREIHMNRKSMWNDTDLTYWYILELMNFYSCISNVKDKVRPRTVHEVPEVAQIYTSTLSLTSTLNGVWLSTPRCGRPNPRKGPVPTVQEARQATGAVWKVAESLSPTGIRSLSLPVRSESLYRLNYT